MWDFSGKTFSWDAERTMCQISVWLEWDLLVFEWGQWADDDDNDEYGDEYDDDDKMMMGRWDSWMVERNAELFGVSQSTDRKVLWSTVDSNIHSALGPTKYTKIKIIDWLRCSHNLKHFSLSRNEEVWTPLPPSICQRNVFPCNSS